MGKDPIKKAKNGTYYFRANIGYDTKGKKIQKYCSGYASKSEARDEYSRMMLMRPEALAEAEEVITFKEYIEEFFLPWYKTKVKIQTYESRICAINKYFSYFFKFAVDAIKPNHVQAWQLQLAKGRKDSYVRTVQGLFSMAMDRAIVLGLTDSNPSKIIGNVKKQKQKIEFWTKAEFERVVSVIYTDDYYQHYTFIVLWLLFMSGMRIGEATALQWSDLDFDTGILAITKTLYYKSCSNYSFTAPKTKASTRRIVLDTVTLAFLQEWHDRQQALIKTSFILSYSGFPTPKGSVSRVIDKYAEQAGVHRISVHGLRHSHASLLISLGENALVVRDRLGHEDVATTLGTCGHLYPNSNFDVAEKLNNIIAYEVPETRQVVLHNNIHTWRFQKVANNQKTDTKNVSESVS